MNRAIFKAYDIRGAYPQDVNEESVTLVAKACVKLFPEGEVILAHDARHGSPELMHVLHEVISKEAAAQHKKIELRVVGMATTPMFYYLVNHFEAVGGCMITASHNPKTDNGIKIVKAKAKMVAGTELLTIIDSL